ncbi:calcium-binding protein CML50 [Pyrus ussuriensis x Pyrus communis]|uniref:Calcium-binding protein CML50 n=1 Tax=Pyrus ussuriensis x Pyrus communis TaxID=2448454 RepID=A0A5N5H691_9ROSA|nr:calcium-binding protein CML50 [Pyrus ussuriensis x Pyrus communis]
MSGYSHPPPGYGYSYGSASPPGQPYGAPRQGQLQHQQHQTAQPYDAPSAPYGSSYKPEKPHNPAKPHKNQAGGGGYPAPAPSYGSLFAALVPSVFPPGTDPEIIACFQLVDQDGSGFIDNKEMQRALSSYNQSFSLRTVHLLMYLFTQTNTRKIGNNLQTLTIHACISVREWVAALFYNLRNRNGSIDANELRDGLLSLGFAVSPVILELLVSKFDKTGGRKKAIEYDNFIECCLTVKGLTEKFKEKDKAYTGMGTLTYEDFMLTVLPFLIA